MVSNENLEKLTGYVECGDQDEIILFFVFHTSQVDDYVRALDDHAFGKLLGMIESADSKIPYLVSVAAHERTMRK